MSQQKISDEHMTHVRRSLAEAGIYFDKLCINQAYFNSQINVQPPIKKQKISRSNPFWHKLLCSFDVKNTSTPASTQTVLTVRDDQELIPSSSTYHQRFNPSEHAYDRRRYRPLVHHYPQAKESMPIRRRHGPIFNRSVQPLQFKETIDNVDDEFAV